MVVPGHPEHGPFYLVTGLLNVLQTAAWRRAASLPTLSLRILSLLSTYAQRQLPYRVAGVDSNDVLYAAEPSYASELRALSAQVRHECGSRPTAADTHAGANPNPSPNPNTPARASTCSLG